MVIGGSFSYSIPSFKFGRCRNLKFVKYELFVWVTRWLTEGYSWLFVKVVNIYVSAIDYKGVYHYPQCVMKYSCYVTLETSVKSRYLNGTSISSTSDYRLRRWAAREC